MSRLIKRQSSFTQHVFNNWVSGYCIGAELLFSVAFCLVSGSPPWDSLLGRLQISMLIHEVTAARKLERKGSQMKSLVVKRSIVIGNHKTSISLEDAFWNQLRMIAAEQEMRLSELVSSINASREHGNLSSALRLFVLRYYTHDAERQPHTSGRDLHRAVA